MIRFSLLFTLLVFLSVPVKAQENILVKEAQHPLSVTSLGDGTLQAVTSVEEKRRLESDPLAGIDAEGKKISRKAPKDENAAEPPATVEPGKAESAGSGADTESTAAAPMKGRKPVGK